jgi:hypothetical protein
MNKNYLERDLKHISIKNLNLELISKELNKNGYFVCDNLVDIELINSIAEYWKQRFLILNHNKPNIKMVRGNLHLGEKDFDSYTNNHKWNLFRIFEFYWNQPKSTEDKITKEIALDLHRIKNVLAGEHQSHSLGYESSGDGAYLSVSHYPPDKGFMEFHADAFFKDEKLYHFMVNLTFKGEDYSEGGLHIVVDKKKIDVDSLMKPGSVLFYDGGYKHGVEPVHSDTSLGRIAFFSIPAPFFTQKEVPNFIRLIEKIYFKLNRALK